MPKNKRSGESRNQYNTKQNQILNSATNLIEIDLLRNGEPPLLADEIDTH